MFVLVKGGWGSWLSTWSVVCVVSGVDAGFELASGSLDTKTGLITYLGYALEFQFGMGEKKPGWGPTRWALVLLVRNLNGNKGREMLKPRRIERVLSC